MHPLIGNLCVRPEGGVDHDLLVKLSTVYTLDDLQDMEEIDLVSRSWRDATQANLDETKPTKGRTVR